MRAPPSTQMTARTPMTCARISLATCAILLACAARRVKRIACVRCSSCVSRFIVCRVACCALSCWLCCAVLSYGDALRWLCGAACCAWSGGYLSLFVVRRGAVWWRWCCRGAVLSAGLLSAPPALRVMLCYLLLLSYCVHWLPPVILSDSIRCRSALACFGCAALALRI